MAVSDINSGGRVWILAGELKIGADLRIPLIDSIIPAGADLGVDNVTFGYTSADLTAGDISRLRSLIGSLLPQGYSGKKGPLLAAAVRVGGKIYPLVFAPALKGTLPAGGGAGNGLTAEFPGGGAAGDSLTPVSSPGLGGANRNGTDDTACFMDLNKTVGPVHVGRVGVGYKSGSLLLLADVDAGGGGLSFGTRGLGAEIPLNNPKHPAFHLDGLSLGYSGPQLTIAGEFVRLNFGSEYSLAVGGMAVVQTPAVSVSAMGFYAQKSSGGPSLFCFGVLDLSKSPVGPPMFRLEKLAAGFGYQTQVRTPSIAEMREFPFVKMLTTKNHDDHPLEQLDVLLKGHWVKPAPGEMWLAAGLEALVFELVHVSAVAIVQFGNELVAGLYGHAVAQFPKQLPNLPPVPPWAELAIDVRAEYRSSSGVLEIDAAVTDESFVIDRNCKLTGGVAVRLWFGNSKHPWDFVVSVGGYHPKFDVPSHYPRPARLGFDWHLSDRIHAWGNCYAALTPHAFMAGMNVGLQGNWGPASIDATVYADALLEWDPLYFTVDWGGRINATLFGVTQEASAGGHVWGPPVGGHAHIEVLGVPINVDFGEKLRSKPRLSPAEFRQKMLPGGTKPRGGVPHTEVGNTGVDKVVALIPTKGLVPSPSASGGAHTASQPWAFAVRDFALQVTTAVPLTSVRINEANIPGITSESLHIRSLEVKSVSSSMKITVKPKGGRVESGWERTTKLDLRGVPAALWDTAPLTLAGSGLVKGYASAVTVTSPVPQHPKAKLIPADRMRKHPSITMLRETKTQNYTGRGINRLPTMTEEQLAAVSNSDAKQTRRAFLKSLKELSIPGFSTDGLTQSLRENIFDEGTSGNLDALPQILEG